MYAVVLDGYFRLEVKEIQIKIIKNFEMPILNHYILLIATPSCDPFCDSCEGYGDRCPGAPVCQNGGSCFCDNGPASAECLCFNGYQGTFCEIPPGKAMS